MSFWDRIKPSRPPPSAVDVQLSSDKRQGELLWDDGLRTRFFARALRQGCPCAGCVDEWTHQRTLDVAKVPEDLSIEDVKAVGNYALAFRFSDGHQTGIYNWSYLRELTAPPPTSS